MKYGKITYIIYSHKRLDFAKTIFPSINEKGCKSWAYLIYS